MGQQLVCEGNLDCANALLFNFVLFVRVFPTDFVFFLFRPKLQFIQWPFHNLIFKVPIAIFILIRFGLWPKMRVRDCYSFIQINPKGLAQVVKALILKVCSL